MATTKSAGSTMDLDLKPAVSIEETYVALTVTVAKASSASSADASSASAALPSKKRPAEDPTPSMTKEAAAKALSSLKAPKQKTQKSLYVRFKALLLKDAKDRGDTETSSNITKVAKDAWAKVKNLTPPPPLDPSTNTNDVPTPTSSNLSLDMMRYLRLKGRVIKDEQYDTLKFNTEANTYCQAFLPAAVSHLQWHLIEATEDSHASLIEATQLIKQTFESSCWVASEDQAPLVKILKEVMSQLKHFKELQSERGLIAKLRNATDEELTEHVKKHRHLLSQVAELNVIKKQKQAQDERKRRAEEEELSNADMIEYEITNALNKQMKYTDSSIKHRSVKISYRRGGVSQKVFAKAFKVAEWSTNATIKGSEVGTKWLRYGACLKSSDVSVKLVGGELVAQASFHMVKSSC